jgi:hypothetical protein
MQSLVGTGVALVTPFKKDLSVDGKYLIIASRHIITYNKHETVIEIARDSTNDKSTYISSPDQNRMLQGFTI